MNQVEVITKLKDRASKDPAANAVFHVWAFRERARNQVTLNSLEQTMKAEGFTFDTRQYSSLLEYMASLGIGKVDRDFKGRLRALKEVKTTLQSIGQAAVGQKLNLELIKQRNKFVELEAKTEGLIAAVEMVKDLKVQFPVSLTVVVEGKPVNFRLPPNLTSEEIARLVKMFQEGAKK